jgi:hypothetical protein
MAVLLCWSSLCVVCALLIPDFSLCSHFANAPVKIISKSSAGGDDAMADAEAANVKSEAADDETSSSSSLSSSSSSSDQSAVKPEKTEMDDSA